MESKLLAFIKDGELRITFKENIVDTMEVVQSLIKFLDQEEIQEMCNTRIIFNCKKKRLKKVDEPCSGVRHRYKPKKEQAK